MSRTDFEAQLDVLHLVIIRYPRIMGMREEYEVWNAHNPVSVSGRGRTPELALADWWRATDSGPVAQSCNCDALVAHRPRL